MNHLEQKICETILENQIALLEEDRDRLYERGKYNSGIRLNEAIDKTRKLLKEIANEQR